MALSAGAKLRASEVNAAVPLLVATAADLSRTSNTTLTDVTGLAVALEANALYAVDAYIAYTASITGDIKLALSVPSGTTGHWAGLGLASTDADGGVGDLTARRLTGFGDSNTLAYSGDTISISCRLSGYLDTAGTAGNLQVRYAQNTSSGTATVILAGTWLRAWKIV